LAFILFFMEFQAPSHGALTVTGTVSFVAGALILFNSPVTPEFQRVSVPLVVGTGIGLASVFSVIVGLALKARRLPVAVGHEALVGKRGEVRRALDPKGMVHVEGELWSAESADGGRLDAGQRVEVVRVAGVRLIVREAP